MEISKRNLREKAKELDAEEICGRKTNIYQYENKRDEMCAKLGATYDLIVYSAGKYGNTGRLDVIKTYDAKNETWKPIKFVFYTS